MREARQCDLPGPERGRERRQSACRGAFALLLLLMASQAAAGAPAQAAPAPQAISYVDGKLRIDALDSTMADVLAKVAALTGVKIEIPAEASKDRMPIVKLGPGPARQILASLLSDSNFDYVIQASDADPDIIQSVLLLPREKKGAGTMNGTDAEARPPRSQFAMAEVPGSPVAPSPESAAVDASPANPPPAPAPPEQAAPLARPLLEQQSNATRPGALAPPPVIDQQNINQQLQQMYQQRMQMVQQDRQTVPVASGK